MAPTVHRKPAILVALAAVLTLLVSALSVFPVRADDGGSGGVPGGSLPGAGGLGVASVWFDYASYSTGYPQGVESASFDWFIAKAGIPRETAQDSKFLRVQSACSTALTRSDARPGNIPGRSRVVGIMWAYTDSDPTGAWPGARGAQYFYDELANWQNGGYTGFYGKSTSAGVRSTAYNLAYAQIGETAAADPDGMPSAICVALGSTEPALDYDLSVSTSHNLSGMVAGGAQAVSDSITTSNGGSSITENLTATVWLNWDGFPSTATTAKSASKPATLPNSGTTTSPTFTPADFGWTTWPAGRFWFDITVGKQGSMKTSVDTTDRLGAETRAIDPIVPIKTVLNQAGTPIPTGDGVTAGMTVTARIKAYSAGSTTLTITDTTDTDNVWLGGTTTDDTTGIHVENASGTTVPATITINPTQGGKTVKAVLAPSQAPAWYTLAIPTTPQPTASDYTIPDHAQACWDSAATICLNTNTINIPKFTPNPDKVWTIDEDGALSSADPDHANQTGADGKVFLPGDAVYAVVNGRIPAHLTSPLSTYRLTDDWTGAAPYVDFSDVTAAKVYLETTPGSGAFTDVTAQFALTGEGTTTVATAKPGFLANTANLSGDRAVKLVIAGTFRTDYDTDGGTVRLTNAGSETWNTETLPTNTPPVFTWTPDPAKDVLGSADQGGDQSSIAGLNVWPGQKLEYQVSLDLRLPDNLAHGAADVTSLGVRDEYDPHFTPDRASVEFYDARTNHVIPRTQYTLAWDADNHTFTAAFNPDWVAANVSATTPDGWLYLRFDGTVNTDTPQGSTVTNRAFQLLNGAATATNAPIVTIPTLAPTKEALNTLGDDINGKNVLQGDRIVYRLTLDATPARSQLAYDVHKLGLVDDYDETHLSVDASDIQVVDQATGENVTDRFNIQVSGGKAYIFARHVDSTNIVTGLTIPGAQPDDLAAYADASINPLTDPIIDQSLMGHTYTVTLGATVMGGAEGDTIANTALQNTENTLTATQTVSNVMRSIDPVKDIVLDPTATDSLNGTELSLYSTFDYQLTSSTIPGNRAYPATTWAITDTLDAAHDYYTGTWAIYATTDLSDGDQQIAAAGDLLADSTGVGADLFTLDYDDTTHTLTATPTPAYLALVNTRGDLPQGFTLYVKMQRIAPADAITNQATETYNAIPRTTELVTTSTHEHPSLSVVKYTLSEGQGDGDRDSADQAYGLPFNEDFTSNAGTQVAITVTNTGDVPLTHVTLTDATAKDTTGTLTDIQCTIPAVDDAGDAAQPGADESQSGEASTPTTRQVPASEVTSLALGQTVDCVGTLTGVTPGTLHTDTATVSAQSVFTATQVGAHDSWNATLPEANDSGSGGSNAGAGGNLAVTGFQAATLAVIALLLGAAGITGTLRAKKLKA